MEESNNNRNINSFGGLYYKFKSLRIVSHYHNVHYIKGTSPQTKRSFKRLCTGQLTNNRLKKKRGKKN